MRSNHIPYTSTTLILYGGRLIDTSKTHTGHTPLYILLLKQTIQTNLIASHCFLIFQSGRVISFHHFRHTEDRVMCAVTSEDWSIAPR
jgi:hypothetical protein